MKFFSILSIIFTILGLVSLLGGAYLHDVGILTKTQIFVVPTLTVGCSLMALVIAACGESRRVG